MSDDHFVREVNDEIRSDQFKSLWDRYGILLISAAVAIVLATAGWRGYEYWRDGKANASGDTFLSALTKANAGDNDGALTELTELEKSGFGAYPVLARMRAATVEAAKGDAAKAVSAFETIANDASVDASIRDMARLRAGLLLVDTGSYEDVAKQVEVLSSDGNPLRHSAREAMGLAAWKAGKAVEAEGFFKQLADDDQAPRNLGERAELMLDVIRSSGKSTPKAAG
jgi:hypothetical protein